MCFNCDMNWMTGGRYLSDSLCVFEVGVKVCTHTDTYLIREELQQKWAQKNYAQILGIQLTLHQTDTEKTQKTETVERRERK